MAGAGNSNGHQFDPPNESGDAKHDDESSGASAARSRREIERTQASERMNALHGTTLLLTWHRDARRRSQTVSEGIRHRTCSSNEELDRPSSAVLAAGNQQHLLIGGIFCLDERAGSLA